jgi:tRNA-2-methylthio-N6-dimethylallyladenosine synthase
MLASKKVFIETYGCQMNFSDTEIVWAILQEQGYIQAGKIEEADVIFLNTCSIRDHAEQRVFNRLRALRPMRKKRQGLVIGMLGCMAERLKESLLKEMDFVDLIAGPDAYRDLPRLLEAAGSGNKGINVMLSAEETYADINPVRAGSDGVTAFISIMRGCTNFCAYCVVPYTRGSERSRDPKSILGEAKQLFEQGYREITLLGQNVNSYHWNEAGTPYNFATLLGQAAQIHPDLRIRFATSHPKDLSDELINVMTSHENICRCIHLPLQSGSDRILKAMNRKYTLAYYLDRVTRIRELMPDCAITTDLIAGFCGETEEDHQATLNAMKEVGFEYAFMFKYSERPGTPAAEKLADDVPDEVKSRRLNEIIDLQQELSLKSNKADIGKTFRVLAERYSKRSQEHLSGRNSQNKMLIFPAGNIKPGSFAEVRVRRCTAATLIGELIPS